MTAVTCSFDPREAAGGGGGLLGGSAHGGGVRPQPAAPVQPAAAHHHPGSQVWRHCRQAHGHLHLAATGWGTAPGADA